MHRAKRLQLAFDPSQPLCHRRAIAWSYVVQYYSARSGLDDGNQSLVESQVQGLE